MKKIILFSNTSWSLYNFRINLIKKLIAQNYKVIILSNRDYTTKKLIDLGCSFYKIKLDRRGDNFLKEFITLFSIYKKIKLISPNFIFNFTIKPIIYGSLASRILNIKTLNTLDGLGATF
jgi:UDP-N-acetylglucosamine:LPS N-acetylglucosamine transferase